MTDAERTLLLLLAASVRFDLISPWSANKPRDAWERANSIKDLADKVQTDAANDNQTESPTNDLS